VQKPSRNQKAPRLQRNTSFKEGLVKYAPDKSEKKKKKKGRDDVDISAANAGVAASPGQQS
jgi:hypothetical protein